MSISAWACRTRSMRRARGCGTDGVWRSNCGSLPRSIAALRARGHAAETTSAVDYLGWRHAWHRDRSRDGRDDRWLRSAARRVCGSGMRIRQCPINTPRLFIVGLRKCGTRDARRRSTNCSPWIVIAQGIAGPDGQQVRGPADSNLCFSNSVPPSRISTLQLRTHWLTATGCRALSGHRHPHRTRINGNAKGQQGRFHRHLFRLHP